MKVAYIAGPYRSATIHGTAQNINAASAVAEKYWQQGYAVICPHKNTAFMDGLIPDAQWIERYIQILSRCDVIIMMADWELSPGATQEHDFAKASGMKIIYDHEERLKI